MRGGVVEGVSSVRSFLLFFFSPSVIGISLLYLICNDRTHYDRVVISDVLDDHELRSGGVCRCGEISAEL